MTSILITNAVRGVGLGVARAFAAMPNANITLQHSPTEPEAVVTAAVDAVRRTMKGNGRVLGAAGDVGSSSGAASLVAEVNKSFGRVDVLVTYPMYRRLAMLEKTTDEDWHATIGANLTSTFFLNREVVPGMRERGCGRIINVTSTDAVVGHDVAAAFSAAKHGVIGLTKSMALELAPTGITANVVCPGLVTDSEELQQLIEFRRALTGEDAEEARQAIVEDRLPTQRLVDADDVGATCVFLALPSSKSINGHVMMVDGGHTAR